MNTYMLPYYARINKEKLLTENVSTMTMDVM